MADKPKKNRLSSGTVKVQRRVCKPKKRQSHSNLSNSFAEKTSNNNVSLARNLAKEKSRSEKLLMEKHALIASRNEALMLLNEHEASFERIGALVKRGINLTENCLNGIMNVAKNMKKSVQALEDLQSELMVSKNNSRTDMDFAKRASSMASVSKTQTVNPMVGGYTIITQPRLSLSRIDNVIGELEPAPLRPPHQSQPESPINEESETSSSSSDSSDTVNETREDSLIKIRSAASQRNQLTATKPKGKESQQEFVRRVLAQDGLEGPSTLTTGPTRVPLYRAMPPRAKKRVPFRPVPPTSDSSSDDENFLNRTSLSAVDMDETIPAKCSIIHEAPEATLNNPPLPTVQHNTVPNPTDLSQPSSDSLLAISTNKNLEPLKMLACPQTTVMEVDIVVASGNESDKDLSDFLGFSSDDCCLSTYITNDPKKITSKPQHLKPEQDKCVPNLKVEISRSVSRTSVLSDLSENNSVSSKSSSMTNPAKTPDRKRRLNDVDDNIWATPSRQCMVRLTKMKTTLPLPSRNLLPSLSSSKNSLTAPLENCFLFKSSNNSALQRQPKTLELANLDTISSKKSLIEQDRSGIVDDLRVRPISDNGPLPQSSCAIPDAVNQDKRKPQCKTKSTIAWRKLTVDLERLPRLSGMGKLNTPTDSSVVCAPSTVKSVKEQKSKLKSTRTPQNDPDSGLPREVKSAEVSNTFPTADLERLPLVSKSADAPRRSKRVKPEACHRPLATASGFEDSEGIENADRPQGTQKRGRKRVAPVVPLEQTPMGHNLGKKDDTMPESLLRSNHIQAEDSRRFALRRIAPTNYKELSLHAKLRRPKSNKEAPSQKLGKPDYKREV